MCLGQSFDKSYFRGVGMALNLKEDTVQNGIEPFWAGLGQVIHPRIAQSCHISICGAGGTNMS